METIKNLAIEEIEKILNVKEPERWGIKTDSEITYIFVLDFKDPNFGKKKGWLKDEGAKWDQAKKRWVLRANHLDRCLVDMIYMIER